MNYEKRCYFRVGPFCKKQVPFEEIKKRFAGLRVKCSCCICLDAEQSDGAGRNESRHSYPLP